MWFHYLKSAVNTDYLHQQLRDLQISVNDNQLLTLDLQQVECTLPGDGKVGLKIESLTHLKDKTEAITLFLMLGVSDGGKRISLEQFQYLEGQDLPIAATAALLSKINELLSLRHLRLMQRGNSSLSIERIEVETGKVMLWFQAHIEQIFRS